MNSPRRSGCASWPGCWPAGSCSLESRAHSADAAAGARDLERSTLSLGAAAGIGLRGRESEKFLDLGRENFARTRT